MNMVDKRCSCCGGENPEKVQIDAILARYQGKKGSFVLDHAFLYMKLSTINL